MGTISRYNSVQCENLNANELVGVTLVYKSVNRDGETHYSGLNFAGDEYTPKDKTQDEIFRVWKNVVATFWTVKAVEAGCVKIMVVLHPNCVAVHRLKS